LRKQPIILAWLGATLALSLATIVLPEIADWLALVPAKVFHGQIWRLGTWVFLELGPFGLLFSVVTMYKFGGDLLAEWSDQRFLKFVGGIVVGSAVGACLLSLPIPNADWYPKIGGYALGDALVIAWALQFPDKCVVLYRMITLRHMQVAYAVLGMNALFAIYFGITYVAPELIASVAAIAYMKRWWDRPTPQPVSPARPWAN
jgi:membrane associated rhomboid family serine protease